MNEEQNLQQDMTPNEAAASLAFATHIGETMATPQDASQSPEMPQDGTQDPNMPQDTQMEDTGIEMPDTETPEESQAEPQEEPVDEVGQKLDTLTQDFEGFKKDITKTIDSKIGDLTKTIKDALKD